MKIRIRPLLLAVLAALGASGCVQTTPRWDSQFGSALKAALAVQVVDPAALQRRDPGTGLEGEAARSVHQRYLGENAATPAPLAPLQLTGSAAK